MTSPEEKERHQRRRKRNFLAKTFRETKVFKEKVLPDKKKKINIYNYELEEDDDD